jgi:hypothetical protein
MQIYFLFKINFDFNEIIIKLYFLFFYCYRTIKKKFSPFIVT